MYTLRELEREDVPIINRWRRDPELISRLIAPYRYINREVDEAWFEGYMQSRSRTIRCAICEDGELIGLISLLDIDRLAQCAQLGIMIGPGSARGRGAGSFALGAMLRHAFLDMNLHRIELEALEDNIPARRLYEKNSFKQEGCRRKAVYKNGRFVNAITYAVLREDWEENS